MALVPWVVSSMLLLSAGLVESKASPWLSKVSEKLASKQGPHAGLLRPQQQRSGRQLLAIKDEHQTTLLRGYQPKQGSGVPLESLRRKLNMPKPSSGGGGSSGSGGGGGGGGDDGGSGDDGGGGGGGGKCSCGSLNGKGYLGCLGFTSSELSSAWIFSGSPPVCGYTHEAGYNSFYSNMYSGGYFNGYDYSNVASTPWGASSYNGGAGYFSGTGSDSQGDSTSASSSSSWGGSSYSGGADGYFTSEQGNEQVNGNAEGGAQGDTTGSSSSAWGGSSYSGGSGYISGGEGGETSQSSGQAQVGDQYGGFVSGESIDVSGGGVYSPNGYDYSNIRQSYGDDNSQVSLTNANFENVVDGSEDASGQQGANGNNGKDGQQEGAGDGTDSSSSYQDTYDPYSDFNIEKCETYQNLWLWDLSLTCQSEDSLYSCRCMYAEELQSLGLLSCAHMSLCPSSCPICTTCLQLLGCSASSAGSQTTTASSSASTVSSGSAYALGAAAGLLVFGASYFVVVKRRQGANGGDLGAHLMTDQPVSGLSFGSGDSQGSNQGKGHVWLAPAAADGRPASPSRPSRPEAETASGETQSADECSSAYTFDDVGMPDDAESIGKSTIATLDEVFEAGGGTSDTEFDKIWLAPVN